jgi:tetratricopeptide (TPR) repeat protein
MSESARRIAELQRELATHPGSRQFYQLGELLRREGRSREAADALRSGLAHHPRYVAAWVALGRACVDAGQAAEAVEGLEQALALDRQNPVAWRLLGEAYLALGDRPAALDAWKQCIELVPGDDVLQAAVDGLSADLAAEPAPEPAAAPPPAPFETEIAAATESAAVEAQVPGPSETALPQTAPVASGIPRAVEAAPPAARPEPPAATDTAKIVIQPLIEAAAEAPPAAPGTTGQAAVTTDVAEDLFPEAPALAPVETPDVQGTAKEPVEEVFARPETEAPGVPPRPVAPAPQALDLPEPPAAAQAPAAEATHEEELFTAPDSEQAPTVLKAVLQAPSAPISRAVQSHPPATLALARLYVQQQALGEATLVLERLLEREPGNTEARDLLSLVQDMLEPLPAAPPPLSQRERKIAALQHWLACLTLGQERATR